MTTEPIEVDMGPYVADEKYIVFKRGEFNDWWNQASVGGTEHAMSVPNPLADAVVIRTKDPFSGPALHSYAATLNLYVALSHVNGGEGTRLREVAHYFEERATEADATFEWKLPD